MLFALLMQPRCDDNNGPTWFNRTSHGLIDGTAPYTIGHNTDLCEGAWYCTAGSSMTESRHIMNVVIRTTRNNFEKRHVQIGILHIHLCGTKRGD